MLLLFLSFFLPELCTRWNQSSSLPSPAAAAVEPFHSTAYAIQSCIEVIFRSLVSRISTSRLLRPAPPLGVPELAICLSPFWVVERTLLGVVHQVSLHQVTSTHILHCKERGKRLEHIHLCEEDVCLNSSWNTVDAAN